MGATWNEAASLWIWTEMGWTTSCSQAVLRSLEQWEGHGPFYCEGKRDLRESVKFGLIQRQSHLKKIRVGFLKILKPVDTPGSGPILNQAAELDPLAIIEWEILSSMNCKGSRFTLEMVGPVLGMLFMERRFGSPRFHFE